MCVAVCARYVCAVRWVLRARAAREGCRVGCGVGLGFRGGLGYGFGVRAVSRGKACVFLCTTGMSRVRDVDFVSFRLHAACGRYKRSCGFITFSTPQTETAHATYVYRRPRRTAKNTAHTHTRVTCNLSCVSPRHIPQALARVRSHTNTHHRRASSSPTVLRLCLMRFFTSR